MNTLSSAQTTSIQSTDTEAPTGYPVLPRLKVDLLFAKNCALDHRGHERAESLSQRYNIDTRITELYVKLAYYVGTLPEKERGPYIARVLANFKHYPPRLTWVLIETIWNQLDEDGQISLLIDRDLRAWALKHEAKSEDINPIMVNLLTVTPEIEEDPFAFEEEIFNELHALNYG